MFLQVNVFFSAHGVPKSYVEEAGDPYKEEMEECVALIMNELRRRGRWVVKVLGGFRGVQEDQCRTKQQGQQEGQQ